MNDLRDNYYGFLVDSHITDHHASFLRELTPEDFVARMKQTGADSVVVYAWCHNGNCYYPTKVGYQHPALKGRDFYGETIALLRKENILARAYCTFVYHRRVAREHPAWRITQIDGAQNHRRSWYCCPNNIEYRAFARSLLAEACAYDIASIFIDMTFWPGICVCHSCRERYLAESGREIPEAVDWNSTSWVAFQRSRERWLSEYAHELTAAVKAANSRVAVAHQFSPVMLGWMYGQTSHLAEANDIPSGDFYGGRWQQRFGTKLLAAFERELPFEYMTSRCVTLYDHTSTKSDAEMARSYATTLANGGTHLLIDAINPDGTLEPRFYDRVQQIALSLEPFKNKLRSLRPKLVADTGLYYSMASFVRREHNRQSVRAIMNPANNMLAITDIKPLQEVIGTSIVLGRSKIPYRVVRDCAQNFAGLKSIIINDAAFLSRAEVDRLRQFVHGGGTLIATGLTSYYDLDGNTSGDFALNDLFGVSFAGSFSKDWNYLVSPDGEQVSNDVPCPLVVATSATVLARLAEPIFDRDDLEHFAAYHSNPPTAPGPHVAMTVNRFGRGTCVYLCSSIFAKQQESQQSFCERLLRKYAPSSILTACHAPPCVEVTLLRGTRSRTYLLCLVNYQEEPENVPVHDADVELTLSADRVIAWRSVAGTPFVRGVQDGSRLTLHIPRIDTIEMIEIQTQEIAS